MDINFIQKNQLKILIIEDKFQDIRDAFLTILGCDNIYDIIKKDEQTFVICKSKSSQLPFDKISSGVFVYDPSNSIKNKIEEIKRFFHFCESTKWLFDLFLIDLKLGEGLDGKYILNEFKKSYPSVPVFTLTWTFTKDEIIQGIKKYEVDGFIHKSEIRYLEQIIYEFYKENFGTQWFLIRSHRIDLSHHLRKCILTWRRNSKLLWHGEKAMHLVDHTYKHSEAMHKILDKFLLVFQDKNSNGAKECPIDPLYIFYLSMAIWVHDVGLKGYKDTFWCYDIRKKHPIISGYLIDKYPEIYLLLKGKFTNIQENGSNPENRPIEEIKAITLISTYHLFVAPLTKGHLEIDRIKEKAELEFKYPTKYEFLNKYAEDKTSKKGIITLETLDNKLLLPTALLRFFDVLDKGMHRVGVYEEEDIKLNVCFEDVSALRLELKEEIKKISEQIGFLKYQKDFGEVYRKLVDFSEKLEEVVNVLREYYTKLVNTIRPNVIDNKVDWETPYIQSYFYFTDMKRQKEKILDNFKGFFDPVITERCNMLLDQMFFYLETPLHFFTHRTFKDTIDFNWNNKSNSLDIHFYFNKDFIRFPEEFKQLNRLLQEAWKIFSDISREYQPLEIVFDENKIKFGRVLFFFNDKKLFSFDLGKTYAESQIIFYFQEEKEKNDFKNKLFEKVFKIKVPERPIQEKISDEFFDSQNANENDWVLQKRKWTFRKRRYNNERYNNDKKVKWGLKIEPLYWKGEYEYRLEIELDDCNDNKKTEAIFKKLLKTEPFGKSLDFNFNFTFQNILGEKIFLEQIRNKYIQRYNEIKIEIFDGELFLRDKNSNKLYFVEIEAIKNNKPWQQERVIEELTEKICVVFPGIEIAQKSKIDAIRKDRK